MCYPKKSVPVYSCSNTVYNEDQKDLKNFRPWHVSVSHECLYLQTQKVHRPCSCQHYVINLETNVHATYVQCRQGASYISVSFSLSSPFISFFSCIAIRPVEIRGCIKSMCILVLCKSWIDLLFCSGTVKFLYLYFLWYLLFIRTNAITGRSLTFI